MIYTGIAGLLASKKGTLSILMLAAMTALGLHGKIDGVAFAAGCSLISTVYCWTSHKVDLASIGKK